MAHVGKIPSTGKASPLVGASGERSRRLAAKAFGIDGPDVGT